LTGHLCAPLGPGRPWSRIDWEFYRRVLGANAGLGVGAVPARARDHGQPQPA
jgi:hypothetical protein